MQSSERKAARIRVHKPEQVQIHFENESGHHQGDVFDYSRFGLGVRLYEQKKSPRQPEQVTNITIEAYGEKRNLGAGQIVHIKREKNENFYGIQLNTEFIDMDFLMNKNRLVLQEDEIKSTAFYLKYREMVQPDIRALAADFAFGLGVFKRSLDAYDQKFAAEPPLVKEQLFNALLTGLGKEMLSFLDKSLAELGEVVAGYSKKLHEQNGFYLRKSIWPYLMESPFLSRTNIRPRGYPGDSAMMEMCYQNDYQGSSIFGKLFHKHPISTEAAEAVRYRRVMINDELNNFISTANSKEKLRVMSVACGPAWEMQDFFASSKNRDAIQLVLLDQDEEALGEAQSRIESTFSGKKKPDNVDYIQDSVRVLLRTSAPEQKYGKFDFIYSMGLFDYLAAPVAKAVLNKIFAMAAPGSRIYIGNYHVGNPTRVYMEYLMDWVLLYRDEEHFMDLTADFSKQAKCEIRFDPTASQMFLVIEKE